VSGRLNGNTRSVISVVRFTDSVVDAGFPSHESLGYCQSSANADWDEARFAQATSSNQNRGNKRPAATSPGRLRLALKSFCVFFYITR